MRITLIDLHSQKKIMVMVSSMKEKNTDENNSGRLKKQRDVSVTKSKMKNK